MKEPPMKTNTTIEETVKNLMPILEMASKYEIDAGYGNKDSLSENILILKQALLDHERSVRREMLEIIDQQISEIAERPCPHKEDTDRHEDSCALDGAEIMALNRLKEALEPKKFAFRMATDEELCESCKQAKKRGAVVDHKKCPANE